jgi:hypothetical protein
MHSLPYSASVSETLELFCSSSDHEHLPRMLVQLLVGRRLGGLSRWLFAPLNLKKEPTHVTQQSGLSIVSANGAADLLRPIATGPRLAACPAPRPARGKP